MNKGWQNFHIWLNYWSVSGGWSHAVGQLCVPSGFSPVDGEMMTREVSDCQALLSLSCRSNPSPLYNYMFLRFKHWARVRAGAHLQRQINHQSWPLLRLNKQIISLWHLRILGYCSSGVSGALHQIRAMTPLHLSAVILRSASLPALESEGRWCFSTTGWLNNMKLWRGPSCDWGNIMIVQNNVHFLTTF